MDVFCKVFSFFSVFFFKQGFFDKIFCFEFFFHKMEKISQKLTIQNMYS
jgi:hypothetical protein